MSILVSGELEIFVSFRNQEIVLDTITVTGSTIGLLSFLNRSKITYFARAKTDVTMLSLTTEVLEQLR